MLALSLALQHTKAGSSHWKKKHLETNPPPEDIPKVTEMDMQQLGCMG